LSGQEANAAPGSPPRAGLSLACLGDVMPADVGVLEALRRLGAETVRRRVWQPVDGADAVLINLETAITAASQAHRSKRYCFKWTSEILDLFDGRFILGLANNHIFDYGEKGLLDTLEALDARNLRHAGAGRNLQEAGPVVFDVAGVRLGVICAADPRYQAATKTSAGTFPAIPGLLRESIREVQRDTDIVLVSIHSGQEFLPVPSPRQRQLAELCLEEGARLVSFHHAHCVSGVRSDSRGIVLFGTGNYLFPRGDTPSRFSAFQESAAWRVSLDTSRRKVQEIVIQPILIGVDGLPRKASESESGRILGRIKRCSDRICAGRLRWWRLREMMKPVYLWMNMVNYVDIARRNGVRASLRMLVEGMRAQLTLSQRDHQNE